MAYLAAVSYGGHLLLLSKVNPLPSILAVTALLGACFLFFYTVLSLVAVVLANHETTGIVVTIAAFLVAVGSFLAFWDLAIDVVSGNKPPSRSSGTENATKSEAT